MNVVSTEFKYLKHKNEPKLAAVLDKHQAQVIESFGGLLNMIELCLTNHAASQHIDMNGKQFKLFEQILKGTNDTQRDENALTEQVAIDIKDNNNNSSNTCAQGHDCNGHDTKSKKVQSLANTQSNVSLTPILKPQRQMQITHTQSEFYHSMMILDCNPKNNLCFRLTNNQTLGKKLYHFILSRMYFGVVCLTIFIYEISYLLWRYWDSRTISINIVIILEIIGSMFVIIYCISLMFTANICILKLITNTFDFWFTSYNFILGIVAIQVRYLNLFNYNVPRESIASLFGLVIIQIALIAAIFTFFCVDAIPASINIKRIFIAFISFMMTWYIVALYFYGEDYEWNPFDIYHFKYTKISFKSVIISSGTNLILFVGKPIFSDLIRYFKKSKKFKCNAETNLNCEKISCICCKSNDTRVNSKSNNDDQLQTNINSYSNNDVDYPLTRCTTVYKRPFIKWNKIIIQDEDAAGGLAEVVSGLQANKQAT